MEGSTVRDEEMIEKTITSRQIFEGKVLDVRCDTVSLPNGGEGVREYAVHKGAVCVVPLTDAGEVILVKQYRYAIRKVFLEIPAGKFDFVGEDPREAALRELREETGAIPRVLTPLGALVPSCAILTERIHMFLAEGLTFGETDFDDDEFIELVKIPVDELVDMVMRGEIEDAKTQIAALKVWKIKRDQDSRKGE